MFIATHEARHLGRAIISRAPRLAFLSLVGAVWCLITSQAVSAQSGVIQNEFAKLLASDGSESDRFGASIAISDDTAVVGAEGAVINGASTGAAYIFIRGASGAWAQQAKLFATDAIIEGLFGASVAISDDTVVAGAPYDDDNGFRSGSVYIFVRDDAGVWTQQAKLLASDGAGATDDELLNAHVFGGPEPLGDVFGASVSIRGDTVIVGAPGRDDKGLRSGSAYVFQRDATGIWAQQSKLLPDDGAEDDFFGGSVGINSDAAIIGAIGNDDKAGNSGSAYVFTHHVAGDWTQQAKLLASDGEANDLFGRVTMSENTAVIGAYGDDENGAGSGSAYVFTRHDDGEWTQQVKLLASDGAAGDEFGFAVTISDDTAVIGAAGDGDNGNNSGSAYVFTRDDDGDWTQQVKLLASDGMAGDEFGFAVAISDDTAVVGSLKDDDACPGSLNCNSGSVYAFNLSENSHEDLDDDGDIDAADLALLLSNWGDCPRVSACSADLDGDGVINVQDLAQLLGRWTQPN